MNKEKFKEMSLGDISNILGKTIKHDNENKIITFLGMLLAYTEDSQFNILFNAPSSTGKSYIPIEISKLFPKDSLLKFGYCSPTAFYHDSVQDKDGKYFVDLSRKVLIFLDQPHSDLLSKLRPILSHDEKEIVVKITDKDGKKGLKTKEIKIIGYPAVIYCTANSKIDDQEMTRCFILSPESTQDKIQEGISQAIEFESLGSDNRQDVYSSEDYLLMCERIGEIRKLGVKNIVIKNTEKIKGVFNKKKSLDSRDMRSSKRLVSLIKASSLINVWHRDFDEDTKTIYANDTDIDNGLKLWDYVSETQSLGIPPHILRIFEEVIYPLIFCLNKYPMTRKNIQDEYYEVFGSYLSLYTLRAEILPCLISAGLIYEEPDEKDKRRSLIHISKSYSDKKIEEIRSNF